MDTAAIAAYNLLKKELEKVALHSIDEDCSIIVKCDASKVAISTTLNQGGRLVAFMSRTLQNSELHYPSVENKAIAIILAVHIWHYPFAGGHFILVIN